ncbi:MAG: AraC family transcriptional regulator [Oscillospiraceae bacterium]|jgi:AraC-like DNA-binding protein|nr:AraC family transcriptional regulator [Oscillospiraceae bacterium]
MQDSLMAKCKKYQRHFSELFEIGCKVVDIPEHSPASFLPERESRNFCARCRHEDKNELPVHLRACREAHGQDGSCIYRCPIGLTFIAASISGGGGELVGGLILGPVLTVKPQSAARGFHARGHSRGALRLPIFPARKVKHMAELSEAVARYLSGPEKRRLQTPADNREKILDAVHIAQDIYGGDDASDEDALLQFEKDLRMAVVGGEKETAIDMINEMLAQIYVYSGFDFAAVKARLSELLIILSRATVEAGAGQSDTFRVSEDFISRMEQYSDVDQLAFWISDVVRRFTAQAFDLAQVKHSDVIFKVTNYIKKNSAEKLSLESIAQEFFMSRSYLSSIFKQETGLSITSYVTRVRVEKSKKMLADGKLGLASIAMQCGFKDQSYFTKVFKKEMGISPNRYRARVFSE